MYFFKLQNVILQIAKCNSPTCKKHFCKKCHQSNLYSVVFTVGESIMELDQVHLACRTLLWARVNRMTGMIRVGYFWWEIFFGTFFMGYLRWEIFSEKGVMENVSWTNLEKNKWVPHWLRRGAQRKREEEGGIGLEGEEKKNNILQDVSSTVGLL